jgi:hypothetical protein
MLLLHSSNHIYTSILLYDCTCSLCLAIYNSINENSSKLRKTEININVTNQKREASLVTDREVVVTFFPVAQKQASNRLQ